MNYLAHIFLAQHSDEAMVGALLGDFAKGHVTDQYPVDIAREILLHRQVDRYTDSHPIVKAAVQLFAEPRRRYAGILLDVFYDHLLVRNWNTYSTVPLSVFIPRFYRALKAQEALLPERLRYIMPRMIEQDWLGSYGDFSGVEIVVARLASRLSRNQHLLIEGLDDLRLNDALLAEGFRQFFPELIAFAETKRIEINQSLSAQSKDAIYSADVDSVK